MAQDAIALLKAQHKTARDLLKALVATTDRGVKTRKELLAKIQSELSQHMAIEEEIFYPEFKRAVETKKDKRLYYEAQEEHKAAKKVLKDIVHADPATVAFGGKAKVTWSSWNITSKRKNKRCFQRHARHSRSKSWSNSRSAWRHDVRRSRPGAVGSGHSPVLLGVAPRQRLDRQPG